MKKRQVKFLSLFIFVLAISLALPGGAVFAKTKRKSKANVTVFTQKGLIKALKNKKLKKLTIKTKKQLSFEIPAQSSVKYNIIKGFDLVVKAPNARFTCKSEVLKSLDIEAVSCVQGAAVPKIKLHNSTSLNLYENVRVNNITVVGDSSKAVYSVKGNVKNMRIDAYCRDAIIEGSVKILEETDGSIVTDGSSVNNIASLNINGGGKFQIKDLGTDNMNLNNQTSLAINNTSSIRKLAVNGGGKDSYIDTSASITVEVNAPTGITVGNTAENTLITIRDLYAVTGVENHTTKPLKVFTPSGPVTIEANYTKEINPITDGGILPPG